MKKKFLFGMLAVLLAGFWFGGASLATTPAVARVGNSSCTTVEEADCYASLADAVTNADTGAIITLLANDVNSFSSDPKLIIRKELTIDGQNQYYIQGLEDGSGLHFIGITGTGDVTIKNVTIKNFGNNSNVLSPNTEPIMVSTTYEGKLTLKNVTIESFNNRAVVIGGGSFDINGLTINGNNVSIHGQQGIEIHTTTDGNTIENTTINNIKNHSDTYHFFGIMYDGNGSVEVTNTRINGDGAVVIASPTNGLGFTESNGTITLGAGNEFETNDDVLAIQQMGDPAIHSSTSTIKVTGGTYTGSISKSDDASVSGAKFEIEGGIFSVNPTASYVVAGKTAVNRGGYYEVVDEFGITFDGNGNEGGSLPIAITSGAGAEIDLPTCNATKGGYTCIGWNTGATAHTGLTSITLTGNTIVYAIFSKSVTGTFYPNGNKLNSGTDNLEVGCTLYNAEPTCEITTPTISNTVTPTVVGYTTTSGSADSASITGNQSLYISGGEEYYAQTMKTYPEITVTFDANGNTVGTTTNKCTPVTGYNGNAGSGECEITSPDITTLGFDPIGWSTGADDHTSSWDVNTTKSVSGDVTYYAQSSKSYSEITVTFDVNNNGGTNTGKTCTPETVYNGAAGGECNIESPDITPAVGFTKIGWSTGANDHTSSWAVGASKSVSGDATYYAQSSKTYDQITVTFDVNENGGTSGSEVCTPVPTYNGVVVDTCTVTCPSITPASEFTTIGWGTTNDSHSADACSTGGTSPAVSGNTTYYAQSSKPEYTVTATYDVGTGVSGYSSISNTCNVQAVYNGAPYEACDITLPDITLKDGYGTGIWSTGSEVKIPGDSISLLGDDTYTASATPNDDTQYLVEYYQENLSGTYDVFETYTGAGTTDTTAIATGDDKSYSGFVFSGTHANNETSGNINGSGDLVLKLHYDRLEYELVFVVDGNVVQSGNVKYGADIVAPANPTKGGYTFVKRDPALPATMPSNGLTVNAVWQQNGSSGGGGGGGSSKTTTKTDTKATTGDNKTVDNDKTDETKTDEDNTELTDGEENNTNDNKEDRYKDSDGDGTLDNGLTKELVDAYVFAYENGITTMESPKEADMFGPLTRIAMAKMLSQYAINVLGKTPDTTKEVPNFPDVDAQLDADYSNGVTLAYQLGIMGINIEEFRPFDLVTRAEFGTALSRMLFGLADGEGAYYETHLAKLLEEEIITNDNPDLQELRGYVMIMLMRSANK